jgi:hypothetical protein
MDRHTQPSNAQVPDRLVKRLMFIKSFSGAVSSEASWEARLSNLGALHSVSLVNDSVQSDCSDMIYSMTCPP